MASLSGTTGASSCSAPGSDPSNIVDAGYPVGSIQVPGGVEPIILHGDAVSGGGYAMVATVISADMDLVGQCAARHADALSRRAKFRPGPAGPEGVSRP